jgi:sec-independent protein translocase protein TatB
VFGIGFSELALVAIAALIFIGPEDLPKVMRQLVKFFREMRQIGQGIKAQFDEVMVEAGVDDIKAATRTVIDLEGKSQIAYDVSELRDVTPRRE